jgi:hypothetical protein
MVIGKLQINVELTSHLSKDEWLAMFGKLTGMPFEQAWEIYSAEIKDAKPKLSKKTRKKG